VSYIFFALILIVSLVQPMLSRRRAEEAAK
jgi:multiple sugar transport system permease protein